MTQLPFHGEVLDSGKKLLEDGNIGQIIFSDATYQVEVYDPHTKSTFWPFIQLTDSGEFRDYFCSCDAAGTSSGCPHLVAAALRIFSEARPLHVRFADSFWNQLLRNAASHYGFDHEKITVSDQGVYSLSHEEAIYFSIEGKSDDSRAKLEEFLTSRAVETEETSLKFSNLPQEELDLWKKGNPSFDLRFELSFWSDLAKWFILLQEDAPYTVTFSGENLPSQVEVSFKGVRFSCVIKEEDWPGLILPLKTIQSPLEIHEFSDLDIKQMRYDSETKTLFIDSESVGESRTMQEGITLGEWAFLKGNGFYKTSVDPLLEQSEVTESKIGKMLSKHGKLVKKYLKETSMNLSPIKAQYELFFNGESQLHIRCYAFNPQDLNKPKSAFFGSWAYIEEKGFFLLEDLLFDQIEEILPKEKIGSFVSRNKNWLNQFDGYQTHLASVESNLEYRFDEEEQLCFESHLEIFEDKGEILDLDEWVYIREKGFYPKSSRKGSLKVTPGIRIDKIAIPEFIRDHRDELEHIRGFFSSNSPIEKAGLSIMINEEDRIVVEPQMQFLPPYNAASPKLFEEFVFVEGEGFSEIPIQWRLPKDYATKKIIPQDEEEAFIIHELETLQKSALSLDPRLIKPSKMELVIEELERPEKGKGIFASMYYQTEFGRIDLPTLSKLLDSPKNLLLTPAGILFSNSPRFDWIKTLSDKEFLHNTGKVQFSMLEWMRLSTVETLTPPKGSAGKDRHSRLLFQEIRNFKTSDLLDLVGLKSELRPYQKVGVNWLWFMYCHDLSSLLCDEMGLGKTHQAMALLAAVSNQHKKNKKKYLVVCPTSVIYHWEELLKSFLPKLRVLTFYGVQRTMKNFKRSYDLLLTSYGTLRSERDMLGKIPFEVAIFDELQVAKNRQSQTHKSLSCIQAKMRLGLSGTPIENQLLELKALFDIILPAYLPTEKLFKEQFVVPIEKNHDKEKQIILKGLVKPFILRRKKTDVLKDLPEKIEEVALCQLSEEQKNLYRNIYAETKKTLVKELENKDEPIPYIHIFSLFSKLKQICDHPSLFHKDAANYTKHESGKWDLFVELLSEIRESRQKVVVFSQYLGMLDIIESHLTKEGIEFAGIRGATKDRKHQLVKFRDDPKCEVFVGSLQAAGVGIDLISASIVIHYDRWWNPAKEDQATDRVHRIGQKRGVQVFKFMTKGTIEEHIHNLIERKKGLVERVVGYDNADELKNLDREEILSLLNKIDLSV